MIATNIIRSDVPFSPYDAQPQAFSFSELPAGGNIILRCVRYRQGDADGVDISANAAIGGIIVTVTDFFLAAEPKPHPPGVYTVQIVAEHTATPTQNQTCNYVFTVTES
jgi:hypothetical protein